MREYLVRVGSWRVLVGYGWPAREGEARPLREGEIHARDADDDGAEAFVVLGSVSEPGTRPMTFATESEAAGVVERFGIEDARIDWRDVP